MRIDLNKLREKGFEVRMEKDAIDISPRDFKPIAGMLAKEYQIIMPFAFDIEEKLHEYQVLSAITSMEE